VLVSLFVSFTLDPMLSSRWYDPDVEEHRGRGFVGRELPAFNRWFDACKGSYERTPRLVAADIAGSVLGIAERRRSSSAVPESSRGARRRLHARLQPRRSIR
jgi:multidrug efflux pump subunit AcrB